MSAGAQNTNQPAHALAWAVGFAVAFRIGVLITAAIQPFANERGEPVSPLLPQSYLDFDFYSKSLRLYANSFTEVIADFIQFYQNPLGFEGGPIISGPVFPTVIAAFSYGGGSYLPLSLFFLTISCTLVTFWLWWLAKRGVGFRWLLIFALLPNPVWFTLVASPDLLFAALFAGFYFFYFDKEASPWVVATWTAFLVLLLLTRPNGYSVLLFVGAHVAWTTAQSRELNYGRITIVGLLLIVFGLFLYPYFQSEMQKAGNIHTYFGHTPFEYSSGIYGTLPDWLDLPVSWLSLVGAKILYFVGLRPSYGITATPLVLLRAAPGIILLPGLIYLLLRANNQIRLLIALFCLPILLGPSQDRYYLPIYPILFLYGVHAYETGWRYLATRLSAASRRT